MWPYGGLWRPMRPYDALWGALGFILWGLMVPYGALCGPIGPHGALWPYGLVWGSIHFGIRFRKWKIYTNQKSGSRKCFFYEFVKSRQPPRHVSMRCTENAQQFTAGAFVAWL